MPVEVKGENTRSVLEILKRYLQFRTKELI